MWRYGFSTLAALIAFCALMAGTACAHISRTDRSLYVEHIGLHERLIQSLVECIFQDSQGFIWFCTANGLVRYDGRRFTNYQHSRGNPNSLPGNWVTDIAEGPHGNLWVATSDGLARWNRAKNNFSVYQNDPTDPHSISGHFIRSLVCEPNGTVIAGTLDAGLDNLNPKTGRFTRFEHDKADPHSLPSNQIYALMRDKRGDLWIGTGGGLDEFIPGQHTFRRIRYPVQASHTQKAYSVNAIVQDPDGDIWVGTLGSGIFLLSPSGKFIRAFQSNPNQGNSLSSDYVMSMLEDADGRLWVGTRDGLNLLNRSNGTFTHFQVRPDDSHALQSHWTGALYQSKNGLIWIATGRGVNVWNPKNRNFGKHQPRWLAGHQLTAFAEDSKARLWVGFTHGLFRFNPKTGLAKSFGEVAHHPGALRDVNVISLLYTGNGLWVGTWGQGLVHLSQKGKISFIKEKVGNPHGLSSDGVVAVLQSTNGTLWLGTLGGGLDALDPKTGLIRRLPYGLNHPNEISSGTVTALAQDSKGDLWIGTEGGGLDLATENGKVVAVYQHKHLHERSLPSDDVWGIAIDKKQRIWVATGAGLALVEGSSAAPNRIHFKVYARKQGLSNDLLVGVLSGPQDNLWLDGQNGVMRFDPETGVVATYHGFDGLSGGQFGADVVMRNGDLAYGGIGSFNIFNPRDINQVIRSPHVVFTNVRIQGKPDPTVPAPWLMHSLHLNYHDTIVSLSAAVLGYLSPRDNRLEFKLSGATSRWIRLPAEQRISLNNLPSGEHVLEVRGATSNSPWSKPIRLRIYMAPKPWESLWAYAAYLAALVLVAIYLVRRVKLERIRQEADRAKLESLVRARTEELMHANEKLATLSSTDSLTGLWNRRHFDEVLSNEWLRCKRGGHSLALMMLDVDWFKQFNDTYGHQAGDDCLRVVASELSAHARRGGDFAVRYGGEEFALAVPEVDVRKMRQLAEAVREAIKRRAIEHAKSPIGVVTVSIGVAAVRPANAGSAESLVRAADKALYRAKDLGRDRVESAESVEG